MRVHVTLAEVPTDVLVYLVEQGRSATSTAIAIAVAPDDLSEAKMAGPKVHAALSLLIDAGYVEKLVVGARYEYQATPKGREAVEEAR